MNTQNTKEMEKEEKEYRDSLRLPITLRRVPVLTYRHAITLL